MALILHLDSAKLIIDPQEKTLSGSHSNFPDSLISPLVIVMPTMVLSDLVAHIEKIFDALRIFSGRD